MIQKKKSSYVKQMVTENQFLSFWFSVWTSWLSLSDSIPTEFVCLILENNEQLIHVSFKLSVGNSVHLVFGNLQKDHLSSWWLLTRPHKSNHKKQPPKGAFSTSGKWLTWYRQFCRWHLLSSLFSFYYPPHTQYTQFLTNSSKTASCICSLPG